MVDSNKKLNLMDAVYGNGTRLAVEEGMAHNVVQNTALRVDKLQQVYIGYQRPADFVSLCRAVLSRALQLQVLAVKFGESLPAECCAAVIEVLQHTTALCSLQLDVCGVPEQQFEQLLRCVATLPLQTLQLHCHNCTSQQLQQLATLLCALKPTLRSWNVSCTPLSHVIWETVAQHGTYLKCLHYRDNGRNTNATVQEKSIAFLLEALHQMRDLEELNLIVYDAQTLLPLTHYFRRGPCKLWKLSIMIDTNDSSEFYAQLCHSLHSVRLFEFDLFGSDCKACTDAFAASHLIEDGWLTSVSLPDDDINKELSEMAARNLKRHIACRKACMTLLSLRKRKQQRLSSIPKQVIELIAKCLYETRNLPEWDRQRDM